MRRYVFLVCAVAILLVTAASMSYATSNLNLSKSNINRVAYPAVVTQAVATAVLRDVDNLLPGADEATVTATVQKHLRMIKSSHGQDLIIKVLRAPAPQKWSILIMEDAADENEAARIAGSAPAGSQNLRPGYDLKSNKGAPKY